MQDSTVNIKSKDMVISSAITRMGYFGVVRDWTINLEDGTEILIPQEAIVLITKHELHVNGYLLSGYFKPTGELQRMVRGTIQDHLNRHQIFTKQNADGLARRLVGQIKGVVLGGKNKPSDGVVDGQDES